MGDNQRIERGNAANQRRPTMTAATYKAIGTTTDHLTCECCGKVNLRKTVVLQFFNEHGEEEGAPVHFGTTCAAKACRARGIAATASEITLAAAKADAAARELQQRINDAIKAADIENALRNARRFAGAGQAYTIYAHHADEAAQRAGFPAITYHWLRGEASNERFAPCQKVITEGRA
jgi:hypothetical protein